MKLPAGMAICFRDAMDELIKELRVAIPSLFQSDEYREKIRAIDTEFEGEQEEAFETLREKAETEGASILRTPMGFALAPTHEGQVIKPEVFNMLPKEQRTAIETKIGELQKELAGVLEKMPLLEKRRRDQVQNLNAELTGTVVDASIKTVADKFADVDAIQRRLIEVREDLVDHADIFLTQNENEAASPISDQPDGPVRRAAVQQVPGQCHGCQ